MLTVIGLGNPTDSYRFTRHNAGFMALDRFVDLQERYSGMIAAGKKNKSGCKKFTRAKGPYVWYKDTLNRQPFCLVKPTTYMNDSGRSVGSLRTRGVFRDLSELLVVVDDVDLELGRIRLRKKGSSAGHNGMKSIINAVGSQDFARLRIGVGPRPAGADMVDYVLGTFKPDEFEQVGTVLDNSAEVIEAWISDGIENAILKAAELSE